MELFDPHKSKEEIDKILSRITKNESVHERNKQLLMDYAKFLKEKKRKEGLSIATVKHQIFALSLVAKNTSVPFDQMTTKDVENLYDAFIDSERATNTVRHALCTFKTMFRWIKNKKAKKGDPFPEEVGWIKGDSIAKAMGKKRKKTKREVEELSEEQAFNVVEQAKNTRDKAILALLYDGALRISELITIRLCDLDFKNDGVYVTVTGKTGTRTIFLILSKPYLQKLKSELPENEEEEYIFRSHATKNKGKVMGYGGHRYLVQDAGRKAGFEGLNPHALRHSRLTFLAQYFTEAQLCDFAGWAQGSKMASVYIGRVNTEDKLKEIYGVKEPDEKERVSPKINCPNCNQDAPRFADYCPTCGFILNPQKRAEKIKEEARERVGDESALAVGEALLKVLGPEKVKEILLEAKASNR